MAIRITPHVVVADASAAAEWYAQAFGARERERIPLPGGRVLSVELVIGDSVFHVGSEFPKIGILSPLSIGGTATVLQLETDDAEALWKRALGAGAEVRNELADTFWGERHGQIGDPFGHHWNIAERVRDVPHDEIVSAAAEAFGP